MDRIHHRKPRPRQPPFQNPGPPFLRQLNITEYTRTIRDLLGITVNVSEITGIYPDPPVTGFSTYAQGLTLDTVQFEKFFRASQIVMGQLFSDETQPWAEAPDRDARLAEATAARAALFAPGAGQPPRLAARNILITLVRRAYRRPVQLREIARFKNLFQASLSSGDSPSIALRKAMMPILVSPSFIYRFEFNLEKIPPGATSHPINHHELAVRLSYFLWSSMPDDTLYRLASSGELADPVIYREQVLRMLRDPRASALSEIFASEWTHLARLKEALPSPQLYPEFNDELKASMHREVIAFFDDLRLANRSIINLIDSDYVFVDQLVDTEAVSFSRAFCQKPRLHALALQIHDRRLPAHLGQTYLHPELTPRARRTQPAQGTQGLRLPRLVVRQKTTSSPADSPKPPPSPATSGSNPATPTTTAAATKTSPATAPIGAAQKAPTPSSVYAYSGIDPAYRRFDRYLRTVIAGESERNRDTVYCETGYPIDLQTLAKLESARLATGKLASESRHRALRPGQGHEHRLTIRPAKGQVGHIRRRHLDIADQFSIRREHMDHPVFPHRLPIRPPLIEMTLHEDTGPEPIQLSWSQKEIVVQGSTESIRIPRSF